MKKIYVQYKYYRICCSSPVTKFIIVVQSVSLSKMMSFNSFHVRYGIGDQLVFTWGDFPTIFQQVVTVKRSFLRLRLSVAAY